MAATALIIGPLDEAKKIIVELGKGLPTGEQVLGPSPGERLLERPARAVSEELPCLSRVPFLKVEAEPPGPGARQEGSPFRRFVGGLHCRQAGLGLLVAARQRHDLNMDFHFTLLLENMEQLRNVIEDLSTHFPGSITDYVYYSTFKIYKHHLMIPKLLAIKNPFNRSQ